MGKDFIESIGIRYGNEGPKMPPIRRLLAQRAASLHRAVIAQTRACGAARARGTDRPSGLRVRRLWCAGAPASV